METLSSSQLEIRTPPRPLSSAASKNSNTLEFYRLPVLVFLGLGLFHFLLYEFGFPFTFSFDHAEWTFPVLATIKRLLNSGELPLWFSEMFGGVPLLGIGSLDLKCIFLLKFLEVETTMVALGSFYLFVAGIGFCFFAKEVFGFSAKVAVCGALFWVLNGFNLWYLYDTPYAPFNLWIPVQIAAMYLSATNFWMSLVICTISFADQLLTGRVDCFEQSVLGSLFFVFLIMWTRTSGAWRQRLKAAMKACYLPLRTSTLAGVLALALTFPILYEIMTVLLNSTRLGANVPAENYKTVIFNFFVWAPRSFDYFGFQDGVGPRAYIGIANLVFIFVGALVVKKRSVFLPFFIVAIVINLFMVDLKIFGINLFEDIFRKIPGHSALMYTIRFLPMYFLFLVPPLMQGISLSFDNPEIIRSRKISFISKSLSTLLALLIMYVAVFHRPVFIPAEIGAFLLVLFLGNLLVLLIWSKDSWAKWGVPLLIVLSVVSAYSTNYMSVSPEFRADQPVSNLHRNQKRFEYLKRIVTENPSDFRVMTIGPERMAETEFLISNGVHSIAGYHPAVPKDLANYIRFSLDNHLYTKLRVTDQLFLGGYDLANVRYWIVPEDPNDAKVKLLESNSTIQQIYSSDLPVRIYESKSFFPRAFLVSGIHPVSEQDALPQFTEKIRREPDWFRSNALVTTNSDIGASRPGIPGTARIEIYRNDFVSVLTDSSSDALLVFGDRFDDRRWIAQVDGQETQVFPTNLIFRGVQVPAGRHKIEFFYRTPTWHLIPSFIGLVFLLICLVLAKFPRKTFLGAT